MSGLVLILEDDLLFRSRVEQGVKAAGYRPSFITGVTEFNLALKTAPVLILVNVGSRGIAWPEMVARVQARAVPPEPAVVGYGPHVDLALRERALEAGCDAVVGRSAVANSMASLLARHAWRPDRAACRRPLPPGIREGIAQFNRREFYACHDSIELVWVDEPGDVRVMYQGLLQLSVAFYHVQEGNWRGMRKMVERGESKLLPFLPACQGVDLESLLGDVERCAAVLDGLGPERLTAFDPELFPVIQMD